MKSLKKFDDGIFNRERNVRNHLQKLGFRLNKAPARHWTRAEYGVGYQIALADNPNVFIWGTEEREYAMSLADIEEFIAQQAADKVDEELRAVLRSYTGLGGDRFAEVAAAMVREGV